MTRWDGNVPMTRAAGGQIRRSFRAGPAGIGYAPRKARGGATMRGDTVRDWMCRGVFACRPDTPAGEVARAMEARDVSALVVVDDLGAAVGVISRTDLASVASPDRHAQGWEALRARDLMSSPVVTVRPETPVAEAARLMREREIHRVIVTAADGGRERPIGVLSVSDLLRREPAGPRRRRA